MHKRRINSHSNFTFQIRSDAMQSDSGDLNCFFSALLFPSCDWSVFRIRFSFFYARDFASTRFWNLCGGKRNWKGFRSRAYSIFTSFIIKLHVSAGRTRNGNSFKAIQKSSTATNYNSYWIWMFMNWVSLKSSKGQFCIGNRARLFVFAIQDKLFDNFSFWKWMKIVSSSRIVET